jgi:uncharacterized membrane protein
MNYQDIKDKYFNKQFIIFYIVIFIILYIFCSFIKFLGQLPVLIILTFLIAYYLNSMMGSKINNIMNNMSSYNLS